MFSKAGLALLVCLVLTAPARAVDWSVKGAIGEAVELSDNQFLKTALAGWSVGSYSTIDANFEGRTPTSKFDFDGSGSYRKYWGPGIDGLASEYISYNVRGRYEEAGKNAFDKSYVEAGYSQQSAALAVFNTLGLTSNASGMLNQTRVLAGLDRSLTTQDDASLWLRSVYTDYDPSSIGNVPFTDVLAVGTWKHYLNSATAVVGRSEVEYLNYQNLPATRVMIARNLAGIDVKLSPLLSVRGSAGLAYVHYENVFTTPVGIGTNGSPASSSLFDFISNILVSYRLLKSTTVYLEASRTVGPTIIGSILTRTNARVGIDHDINFNSTISVFGDYSRLVSPTSTDFASASVQYTERLTKTWTMKLAYTFLHRFTTGGNITVDPITGFPTNIGLGPASSNSVLFAFSKSFVALAPGQ